MAFTQISGNGLKNNSITNAHLHSNAGIDVSKLSGVLPLAGGTLTGALAVHAGAHTQLTVKGTEADIHLTSTGSGSNKTWRILGSTGTNTHRFRIYDDHNSREPFYILDSGTVNIGGNLDVGAGLDVTGNITVSGTVDGRDLATDGTKLDGIAANANNYSFPYTVSVSASNSTIVQRHSSGYIFANFFNTTPNDVTSGVTKVCVETDNDGYIRHGTPAAIRSFINVADGANNVTNYVTDNASDTLTGDTYTFSSSTNEKIILSGASFPFIRFQEGTTNKAFIQWNADGYLRLRNEEAQDELRIGNGNFGLQYSIDGTVRNVLHSGNVGSYALPIGGGTVTGSLNIGDGSGQSRLYLFKADNNVSDHIIFYNGTTRVGEIGCEDNSWLRINQETNKNIYTPRYIRSDGGFFVNGTSKGINGDGNFFGGTIAGASDYDTLLRSNTADTASGDITFSGGPGAIRINDGSDIRFSSGTWTGEATCKLQLHSNVLYLQAPAFIFRDDGGSNRWSISSSGHFVPSGTNNYDVGGAGDFVRYAFINRVYVGNSSRYLGPVSGQYGSVQINGSGVNGYEGYSIDGRYVLMHNGGSDGGLYNDVNNEWYLYTQANGTTIMYFNGSQKFRTESYGGRFAGTFRPDVNNARDLGASDARWATFYVVNQPNVSDRNEKNTIQNSDLGLDFINKLRAVSFKWNDASLGTKTRYGLIVQEVEDAVKELGKNPDDLGMIDKPEFGSMGLCVNELVAPFVKAIQELSAKVAALEAA